MSHRLRVFASLFVAGLLIVGFSVPSFAQEFKVEKLAEAAPEVSPEIAALLQMEGVKVLKGESRTVCDLWFCKEWPINEAKVTSEIMYPFQPGQVIGVIRFPRKSADFRDQEIPKGVYVMRYSYQPVDGAHVGTSPTRDFVALLPAAKDKSAAILDYKPLIAAAKETSGVAHPAILSLQRLSDSKEDLAVKHNEEKDWCILRVKGKTSLAGKTTDQAVEMVVLGVAKE
jgi:hypothetical protein